MCFAKEWKLLHHTMAAQAGRRMMTPGVGRLDEEVPFRGHGNAFGFSDENMIQTHTMETD